MLVSQDMVSFQAHREKQTNSVPAFSVTSDQLESGPVHVVSWEGPKNHQLIFEGMRNHFGATTPIEKSKVLVFLNFQSPRTSWNQDLCMSFPTASLALH